MGCRSRLDEIYSVSNGKHCFLRRFENSEASSFVSFEITNLKKWDLAVLICIQRGYSGAPACTGSFSGVFLFLYGSFTPSGVKIFSD